MYYEPQADGENGFYNINKDIKGTLLTEQKYFGSAVYGGAKDKVSAFTAAEFATLPALQVSLDNLSTAWECGISLHNLGAGKSGTGNNALNYSLRVYVLPVYENGDTITYDTKNAIENHKVYVQDNDVSSAYNALRYYSKSGMYCWFRILTRDANIFTGTMEAEYEAQSYTKKNVELQYSVENSINTTGSTETFPVTLDNGSKSSIPENYV